MFETLPVDAQAYLFTLLLGICAPLVLFWMLRVPLSQFLTAIFRDAGIERFWLRVVLLVLLCQSLAVSVGYQPDPGATLDDVALVWNMADQVQSILQSVVFSMFGLFLPLLLSFTILHIGRERVEKPPAASEGK